MDRGCDDGRWSAQPRETECLKEQAMSPDRILRLPAVKAATGLSRSTIYARISEGTFPAPVALGGRAVGVA